MKPSKAVAAAADQQQAANLAGSSIWTRGIAWADRNRALAAGIAAFLVTGMVGVYVTRGKRRRKARKAINGSKKEAVVLAGPPHSPLTKSISLDLEKRGFVVYVLVTSLEEERIVRSEAKADIVPLHFDVSEVRNMLLFLSIVAVIAAVLGIRMAHPDGMGTYSDRHGRQSPSSLYPSTRSPYHEQVDHHSCGSPQSSHPCTFQKLTIGTAVQRQPRHRPAQQGAGTTAHADWTHTGTRRIISIGPSRDHHTRCVGRCSQCQGSKHGGYNASIPANSHRGQGTYLVADAGNCTSTQTRPAHRAERSGGSIGWLGS